MGISTNSPEKKCRVSKIGNVDGMKGLIWDLWDVPHPNTLGP